MALYRKYRPASLAEVVGQDHVTGPLSAALSAGRINHAYLFSGPRGCGKTSSARILARSLNCEVGPTATPCGRCDSCVALGPGGSGNIDVIELDAASHGGVDDTRDLRDRAFYAPAQSRYRVFIVDEAHMVTTAGFNALLKIVEEPPAHLIFIFATTEPDKVLPTIRSRTHHYPFRLLSPVVMRELLLGVCASEGVGVPEAALDLVIRAGGGSPRDTLSVLDQLVAGAHGGEVEYEQAAALLGVTDGALLDAAVTAFGNGDPAGLFAVVERVMHTGHDPRRFASDFLQRLRDLLVLQAVADAPEQGLVVGAADQVERMREQAQSLGPATLTRGAELLHEGLAAMRGATAPRLVLEIVCSRMVLPAVDDTAAATLQRLEQLERAVSATPRALAPASGAVAQSAAPATSPVTPTFSVPAGEIPHKAPTPSGATSAAATPAVGAAQPSGPTTARETPRHDPTPPAAPDAPPSVADDTPLSAQPNSAVGQSNSPSPVQSPAAPVENPFRSAQTSGESEPLPAAPSDDLEAVRAAWPQIRAAVKRRHVALGAMVATGVSVVSTDDQAVVLSHQSAALLPRLSAPENCSLVADALSEVLGVHRAVQWAAAQRTTPTAASHQPAADSGKKNPPRFVRPSRIHADDAPPEDPYQDVPPPQDPDVPDDPHLDGPAPVIPSAPEHASEDPASNAETDPAGHTETEPDPDRAALELLRTELGATPVDR